MKPTAFVTYSWDSEQHQDWVHYLVSKLRIGGVVATFDLYETQDKTLNLYQMMISAMKDYDYVIIVLTEEYAKRANDLEGGVGFETSLLISVLKQNPDKLILIARENLEKSQPFHLKGRYTLDFSRDQDFDTSFKKLLHRIHGKPMYEKPPVGDIPDLKPQGVSVKNAPRINSYVLESETNKERIVWLLPRGFFVIEDITFQDDPNWNVKAEFWKYDGQPVYGVHYKPSYRESWRDYDRWFSILHIPESDRNCDEYHYAWKFIQSLRERKNMKKLEDLVKEKCELDHHVFYYPPGAPIYLPEVPEDFKVLFNTGELRDILFALESLRDGDISMSERLLSEADALRHELLISAQEYFGENHLSYKAILDVSNDFDSKTGNKKVVMWLDRAASVLEKALDRVLRYTTRH